MGLASALKSGSLDRIEKGQKEVAVVAWWFLLHCWVPCLPCFAMAYFSSVVPDCHVLELPVLEPANYGLKRQQTVGQINRSFFNFGCNVFLSNEKSNLRHLLFKLLQFVLWVVLSSFYQRFWNWHHLTEPTKEVFGKQVNREEEGEDGTAWDWDYGPY